MQHSTIRLIVFDMAGTTIKDENQVGKAFQQAFAHQGLDIPLEEITLIMGYKKPEAIRLMLHRHFKDKGVEPILADKIHDDFVGLMMAHYSHEADIEPLPNVESTFAALKEKGVKIGLNTGFSRDIAETILNRLAWKEKGLIDFLAASDDVENGRPDPAMIRNLMQEAGVTDPLQVAKVGDTEVDIREARNAGCRYAIAVTTGAFSRSELEKHHPDFIIDDIAEVIGIIGQ